jgi:membrane associated rhomboid family serine protease
MEEEEKKKIAQSIVMPFLFVAVLWIIKLSELYLDTSFAHIGILPRTYTGLLGIATGPLLHGDIYHLGSNTLPLLILGIIILYFYRSSALQLFIWLYLVTGIMVWILADGEGYHIGASGLIYGLVSFLFFSGVFRKDRRSLALALLVTFVYGGMVWGVFPLQKGISWESHLFGGLTGLFCAWLYRKSDPFEETYDWMNEDESTEAYGDPLPPEETRNENLNPYFINNSYTSSYQNENLQTDNPENPVRPEYPRVRIIYRYVYKPVSPEDKSNTTS